MMEVETERAETTAANATVSMSPGSEPGSLGGKESPRSISTPSPSSHRSQATRESPTISASQNHYDSNGESQHALNIEPPAPPNRSIYPLFTQPGYRVKVYPYDPSWSTHFEHIAIHLRQLFVTAGPPVRFTKIEHIGSTSIPTLVAKPNIDVLVTLPNSTALSAAIDALIWEQPRAPPFVSYTRVPRGGGIHGRESFKLYVPHWSPYHRDPCAAERSVYLVDENEESNPAGKMLVRCYRDVRDTLRDPANGDLLCEYADVKMRLSRSVLDGPTTYATEKNPIVRKILVRAGWTDTEVDVKERLCETFDDEMPY